MRGHPGHDTRPQARLPPGFGMDDIRTERRFDSHGLCFGYFSMGVCTTYLTCDPYIFVQPGTGRRPVDCWLKLMSVL